MGIYINRKWVCYNTLFLTKWFHWKKYQEDAVVTDISLKLTKTDYTSTTELIKSRSWTEITELLAGYKLDQLKKSSEAFKNLYD